jgi:peptide-methionine (R)-S-oxide reductase
MILLASFLFILASPDRAFVNSHVHEKREGTYFCANCNTPLFSSKDKYDSGSGFPSFSQALSSDKVYFLEDWSLSFKRYQVICRGCNAQLGHVFNDGPPPKGLRYTLKSSTLIFK